MLRILSLNPLLSGSVFLTLYSRPANRLVKKGLGLNPLLSGSVFLTARKYGYKLADKEIVSIPSLAGQFF